MLVSSISILAQSTWTGSTSTDWNVASNWTPSSVPSSTDDVIIPSAISNMPVISTTLSVKSITNNGTITFTSGSILNVYGDITNTGTINSVSGSTVSLTGSVAQNITGVPILYNVTINNTNGVSLNSTLLVKGTISLINGVLTTNSSLTIDFDNGGNIGYNSYDAGSISGDVSGTRNLVSRTHYIAVPFSGVTAAQVQATTPLNRNGYWQMYVKTFANQNWGAVTSSTTSMPLGTGYSLAFFVPAPLIFTGTYSHTFTFTSPSYSNVAPNKYLMVGNPYPSTIDWDMSGWTKINVADAIYYWNPSTNSVATYVAGVGTNGGTRYIPAMQSVLISTTGTGGFSSVAMNNNVRSLQNSNYFRVTQDDIIRITLVGVDTTIKDEAIIRFNEMATDTFDFNLDAHKILNPSDVPSVYTNSNKGSETYSINSFYSIDSVSYIPVGTKLPTDGDYKLKISGTNRNVNYILVDKLLGTQQSIDTSYTFHGLITDDSNRFELQLKTTSISTGVQSANKNSNLSIYSSSKGFVIKSRYTGETADVEIYDITGKVIKSLTTNLSSTTYIPLDVVDGAYLVKVNVSGNIFSNMIILSK